MATKKNEDSSSNLVRNETLGIEFELPEITQGSLETYEREVGQTFDDIKRIEIARLNRTVVEAAIKAGWLPKEYTKESLKEMKPAAVVFIANRITRHIQRARDIPGE